MPDSEQARAIKAEFDAHRQSCKICGADNSSVCPIGMGLHEKLKEVNRPVISADAKYIVKHLWIIFVLLPVMLGVLFLILRDWR